jgi:hypothetical protein
MIPVDLVDDAVSHQSEGEAAGYQLAGDPRVVGQTQQIAVGGR